jgi:hypothetical protein
VLLSRKLGRSWKFEAQAGVYTAEVQGLQAVALDPALAALLGVGSGVRAFYRKTTIPTGSAMLVHNFRSASLNFRYARLYNPGNGLYLTSNSESMGAAFSYTGIRKWAFSASIEDSRMKSIGQDLLPYRALLASVGVTRSLTDSLHLIARVGYRNQEISQAGFRRNSNQFLLGFTYSPGTVPLSLW